MTRAFLGIGSNIDDRVGYLRFALEHLPDVVAESSVFETDPLESPSKDPFLNMVLELDTDLTPEQLLGLALRIETAAGRVRTEHWGPRTLDIDVLWIDGVKRDRPDLRVPHPLWRERRFVLAPLAELAADLVTDSDLRAAAGRVKKLGRLADLEDLDKVKLGEGG